MASKSKVLKASAVKSAASRTAGAAGQKPGVGGAAKKTVATRGALPKRSQASDSAVRRSAAGPVSPAPRGASSAASRPAPGELDPAGRAPPYVLAARPHVSRGLVTIYTYKLAEVPPARVEFSRCMVRFLGFNPAKANPALIWGIHGNASLRSAQAFAGVDAQFRGLRTFRLELNYKVPRLTGLRVSVTEQIARETGYLHCTRISAGYKNMLRKRMVAWLQADKDPDAAQLSRVKFEDLLGQRPMLIHRLMAEDGFLNMVIHPVLLNGGVMLSVGTVRNRPDLIDSVSAGVHTEIVVSP